MAPPLAHHAGEDSLLNLLLLGGGILPLLVAAGRARLAATRARLARPRPGAGQRQDDDVGTGAGP